ncbi:ester cyclase [Cerasicoccus maritimus]|uniref:ester cyclase n=1 Tax=Cerasicoccus maritimus TaxID=490089 RepID=UPI0028525736|nr:ester cyclase [Cerasicoccus maritimus]
MTPIELTQLWHERVWNQADESAIYEMLGENAVLEGLNLAEPGPAGFVPFHRGILMSFEGAHIEITQLIEQDGVVVGHAVFTGIHRASQSPVTIEFSLSVRWEDGKIAEAKNVVDYLPMLSQLKLFSQGDLGAALGLIPPESKD